MAGDGLDGLETTVRMEMEFPLEAGRFAAAEGNDGPIGGWKISRDTRKISLARL